MRVHSLIGPGLSHGKGLGKHLLEKPQYQKDQHYDDDHSYNDIYRVPLHPPPPPLALTHAQNSAKAEIPQDPGPVARLV